MITCSISYDANAKDPSIGAIGITAPLAASDIVKRVFADPSPPRSDGTVYACRGGRAAECARLTGQLSLAGVECEWLIDERPRSVQ